MLTIVVILTELLEPILSTLVGKIRAERHHVNIIVARLIQNKLSFRLEQVRSLEVLQHFHLVLVDGLHQVHWPEPQVIELVHQKERLLRDLFRDLGNRIWVEILEELHDCGHILFVLGIEQQWLSAHTAVQLHGEVSDFAKPLLFFVEIDDATSALLTEQLGCIL